MKRFWDSNQWLKIMSLLFAAILWFYVLNSESMEVERKVMLDYLVPADKAVANEFTPHITVKLKGPQVFMRGLFGNNEKLKIDLRKLTVREKSYYTIPINMQEIPVPFGVEVLSVSPKQVNVVLQRKIAKYVPIKAELTGELPPELRLIEAKVIPEELMIEGPIEVMRKITKLSTNPIDLTSLENDGKFTVHLMELDPRIKIREPKELQFQYVVRSKKANLTIKGVKIRYLSSKRVFSSRYWTVSLSVLAPEGVNTKIKHSDLQVIADLPENRSGQQRIKLRAILPEGIHLLSITPEEITVNLE